jgi:hypothetical protein
LPEHTNYNQMTEAVGRAVGYDAQMIQYSTKLNSVGILEIDTKEVLPDWLTPLKQIYIEKFKEKIYMIHGKLKFDCLVSALNKKAQQLVVYPNKTGTVQRILDEVTEVVGSAKGAIFQMDSMSKHQIVNHIFKKN